MTIQTRNTALQGEYVRLYCKFIQDGLLVDPHKAPEVFVTDNTYYQASSSSSTPSTSSSTSSYSGVDDLSSQSSSLSSSSATSGFSFGPFVAQKENTGIWYVDWLVPDALPIGMYYDVWKFNWELEDRTTTKIFEIHVNRSDSLVNSDSPAIAYKVGDMLYGMINDLSNNFIYEAMHIPVYWEQGYQTGDNRTYNFAFGNWNQDPRPIVRVNQKIRLGGWTTNNNGNVFFNENLDPEDLVYAQYYFRYFKDEEILDFLNMGLYALNATPPASIYYSSLNNAPYEWRFGVILYAAIRALQRLVFGLNFQEKSLIFSETPEGVQQAINNFKGLYSDYNALWIEVKKDVKTLKLPGLGQIVTPEYTLPGGRSRWFRYLYK